MPEKDKTLKQLLADACVNYPHGLTGKPIIWDDEHKIIGAFITWLEQKKFNKNLNFAYGCSADQFQKGEQHMLSELTEELYKS